MTYNVFGGTLNLTQPTLPTSNTVLGSVFCVCVNYTVAANICHSKRVNMPLDTVTHNRKFTSMC